MLRPIFFCAPNVDWLRVATLIPVPPSKALDHPDYDYRMTEVCRGIKAEVAIDVRELVRQTISMEAAHVAGVQRPSVEELINVYEIGVALRASAAKDRYHR